MQLSAGRVLGRSWEVLRAQLLPFLVLAVLVYAPVLLVALIVGLGTPAHWANPTEAEGGEAEQTRLMGQFVVGMLVFLAQYLMAGAVVFGVREHLQGRKAAARDVIATGVRQLLSVVDVAFVTGLLVGAGFLLLVVPGWILACVCYVAVSAAVVEKLDVVGAIRRSAALTRGNRITIFVILLATLGAMFLVGLLVPMVFGGLGRSPAILVGAFAQILFALFAGVCQAVAYYDLRAGEAETNASG